MSPVIQELLSALVRTPALICMVGREETISELFLREQPQKVEFNSSWAAIECRGWHLHVNLAAVSRVRFTEAPGHDNTVSSFAAFEDSDGKSVLRFYFPHASHTHTTYTVEELALFDTFKERYERVLGVGN